MMPPPVPQPRTRTELLAMRDALRNNGAADDDVEVRALAWALGDPHTDEEESDAPDTLLGVEVTLDEDPAVTLEGATMALARAVLAELVQAAVYGSTPETMTDATVRIVELEGGIRRLREILEP